MIDTVIAALSAAPVRGKQNEWEALCPAHGDRHPSLGITLKPDGTILLCCRSQHCETAAIVAAAGLSMSDLFPPKPADYSSPARKPLVAATYDYTDEAGALLYQVLRWEPGFKGERKSFTQQRPDGRGWWARSIEGVRRVLYRLPDVQTGKQAGATIYLPEGEKDVETLRRWAWSLPRMRGAPWSGDRSIRSRSAEPTSSFCLTTTTQAAAGETGSGPLSQKQPPRCVCWNPPNLPAKGNVK